MTVSVDAEGANMATIAIREHDAERLNQIAQRENRSVEDVVAQLIDGYVAQHGTGEASPVRSGYLTRLYAQARAYWRETNDADRLALSDEQLDEQFWCIDPEGIPRLKSDQNHVAVPADGLSAFLEQVWQDNDADPA